MHRDIELETTFAEDRTLPDPRQHHEPRVQTCLDSQFQGEGSDHGLDQPVASAECTPIDLDPATAGQLEVEGVEIYTQSTPLKHSTRQSCSTTQLDANTHEHEVLKRIVCDVA